jgi:SSS family transporter
VSTAAVRSGDRLLLISGEIRPRVRTPQCWSITFPSKTGSVFGALDFSVLGLYLLAMVGVGVWFSRRNKSTDDYFRGGQQVPWWVAGCSIFATMLSSITFMAVPAKAYAQNWVLLLSNLMIPVVAPLAVYLALPFFRKLDATSAYEYLENRFNRPVRMLASGLFIIFHLFRMGIVLSLAGLALTALTPLTPVQSVLLGGVLCVLYSTMGGLLAVVWTDTIQTFVLLGGALLCFVLIVFSADGGPAGMLQVALADGKLHFADLDFSLRSFSSAAVWVVVLGGIGQNISSYLGDQALIQRYMSTVDSKTAARSIWTNAVMAVPSTFLFFGIGTALYVFYKSRPELLDPGMQTDQIFPLFIATQLPAGVAGLVVAGIFAAAQSTISTSMNSTAAALVTDFMRPLRMCRSEQGYFRAGWVLNLVFGSAGTLLGLLFVRPEITSLFDSFLTVIGLFMGLLGGVFLLGMCTRKANGPGALGGMVLATGLLLYLRFCTPVHWLLFAPIGIMVSFSAGYLLSRFIKTTRSE